MGSIWRRLSLFSKVHLLSALFGVHAEFFLDSGNPTGFQYLLIIKRCYSSIFSAVLLTKWNTFTHVLSLLLSVVFVWFSTCSNGWFLLESFSNFSLLFDLFSCVSGSLVLCLVPLFGILVFFQMFPHHNSSVCLKSTRLSGVCYKFELLPVACSFVFWDVAALTVSSLHMRSLSFFLYLRFLQCVDWTAELVCSSLEFTLSFVCEKKPKHGEKHIYKLISWFRAEWTNHTREKGLRGLVRCPQVSQMLIGRAVSDDLDVCVLVFPQLVVVSVMTWCYFILTCSCLLMTNPHKHISLHTDATLLTPTRQCWRHVIIKQWRHPQRAIQPHTSQPTPRRCFV